MVTECKAKTRGRTNSRRAVVKFKFSKSRGLRPAPLIFYGFKEFRQAIGLTEIPNPCRKFSSTATQIRRRIKTIFDRFSITLGQYLNKADEKLPVDWFINVDLKTFR